MKLGKYNYNKVSINKNISQMLSLVNLSTNNKPNEEIFEKIAPKWDETESKPGEFR